MDQSMTVGPDTALYTLQFTSPLDYDLVNKCLDLIKALEGAGTTVHFTWIPSHVGILLNEKADRLPQLCPSRRHSNPGTEYTLGYVKNSIKDFVHSSISHQLEHCCHRGSGTKVFTMYVSPRSVLIPMSDTLHHMTGWQ
ncbi:hypothetical protein E2C01_063667 [Portunus trituberculatus]|uniref:RNase H type-1 domain-containing protein n=1 Tax=Portunus trituberculatus TaxID=210409 RepID=A0A5B7HEA2_PORTR|nr:hypothetical protein [Portunus trituberculatus]